MKYKAQAVSIVIPVYNEEHHLKACLEAIAQQTIMPAEVIVVDNNSTDRSVEIAKQFTFVKVLHEKRQGITFARNAGFDAATSPIIGRIDADTVLPRGWVKQVQEYYSHEENMSHALAGSCVFYNVRLPRVDHWVTSQFVFRMNRLLMGHYILWGANMAVPRRLWQSVRSQTCLDTDIHEDLDLAIHLHRGGFDITYMAGLNAGAKMRRVFDSPFSLWPNLMMWPRTLYRHHLWTWPLSLVGAVVLFVFSWVPVALEYGGRLIGRPPLNDRRSK